MQTIHSTAPIELGMPKRTFAAGLGITAALIQLVCGLRNSGPQKKNVTLLEPYGLGDAISLLPLVNGLLYYGWHVTVCAKSQWRELFPPEVDWIECTAPWASYDQNEKYGINSLIGDRMSSFLSKLRNKSGGSLGIDTRGDARSINLLWLSNCTRVLSLDHYTGYSIKNHRWAAELTNYDPSLRRWQSNLNFLKLLEPNANLTSFSPSIALNLPDGHEKSLDRIIGLIPLAPWHGKLWPTSSWQQLANCLREAGYSVRGLAGPGQKEAIHEVLDPFVNDIVICDSIKSWTRQLSQLSGVVSVDTGPMHLADALHVPLVALYGLGTLPLWAPSGPRSVALHRQNDPDYTPIHPVDANISRGLELMARHTVEDVLHALADVRQRAATAS
jgi:ADP-heptose:LPS heptosyltransferase